MPDGYSYEIREIAKEQFVTEGRTYDYVAESTGVSVSQLKRWGLDEDWTGARKEYREALSSIKRDSVLLRSKLVKAALATGDPQQVYAWAAVEKAVAATRKSSDSDTAVSAPEKLKNINTPEDAVAALQEVVELKLNKMLAQPDILQLSQIRELKQTMELIDQMKVKYAPEAEEDKVQGGLSDEAADMIRRQILGVKS
ncbi:MAG: hypothetical protein KKE62_01920 [Proteobacteria bacterium]|nr:hypothetical protein [Pseudomonadota bacterium]MBU1387104.1 hypothetical protein [Pseudomonadota bacterium]MBU1541579.1 hypothetical protein [Pseudomonadota bacterium]MBU2429525.1 hypothetical protein [Pseudomonadota bacterium]MBU2482536.1 hypothetical protein [Pseudomonadota bacterium]